VHHTNEMILCKIVCYLANPYTRLALYQLSNSLK